MNIVILDGGTTNPGDLSWEAFEALGKVTVYSETPAHLAALRAREADALIVNRVHIGGELMEQLPRLKYIGALATGFNTIDVAAAKKRGIPVCNVPGYCVQSLAQATFALLLALCNHVHCYAPMVQEGDWAGAVALSCQRLPVIDLYGKTLGILGYGNIGQAVADLGRALGMQVIYYSRSPKEGPDRAVELKALYAQSDVLSLHCALNSETRGIVDSDCLALMKPRALLVNTARGALIDETALACALNSGQLGGAGLDVMRDEPPKADNPLLRAKNCLITPHIAWSAPETRTRLIEATAENLAAFMGGSPINRVNP